MIVTTGFNFVALKYLQLDQTVTIFFLTPLLVALLAGPLLHEWVGWHRMVAILVGFLGVLIVMHPGFGTLHWAMLILAHRHAWATRSTTCRRAISPTYDPPEVTQTYTPLAGAVLLCRSPSPAGRQPQDALIWVLLASLGLWGGLGHWLLILAHRIAPASVLAPFIYLGLIWMSAAGFLVFGEVPTLWTLTGGAVVILSGPYLFARERKVLGGPQRPSLGHRLAIDSHIRKGRLPLARHTVASGSVL